MGIKSTGIVRKVDELGRIVLPKELRDTLKIAHKDPLEIYVDADNIILSMSLPAYSAVMRMMLSIFRERGSAKTVLPK